MVSENPAWIYYRTLFDSMSNYWKLNALEMSKVSTLVNYLKYSIGFWETTLHLNNANDTTSSDRLNIQRGIFQETPCHPFNFDANKLKMEFHSEE